MTLPAFPMTPVNRLHSGRSVFGTGLAVDPANPYRRSEWWMDPDDHSVQVPDGAYVWLENLFPVVFDFLPWYFMVLDFGPELVTGQIDLLNAAGASLSQFKAQATVTGLIETSYHRRIENPVYDLSGATPVSTFNGFSILASHDQSQPPVPYPPGTKLVAFHQPKVEAMEGGIRV